jgi:hypothetical protein
VPSTPDRLLALENAMALQQARRLLLLKLLLGWANDNNTNTGFLAFREHLIERIADEGP